MNSQSNDLRQWIQELITRSATDQLYNLKRFEELLRRAASGGLDGPALREEYLNFAREESTRYINDLARVGLSFYNTLLELNRHYNDRFFEQVTQARRSQDAAAGVDRNGSGTEPGQPHVVTMELHAALRAEAARTFILENRRTEPVQVSFLVSEFTSENGAESFRSPLQLNPARFSMRPGEEHPVRVQIPLLPEFFTPGQVYTATVVVSGFENLQLHLRVWAEREPEASISVAPEPEPQTDRGRSSATTAGQRPPPARMDDLTRIKGIGSAYAHKLQETGIQSYTDLANAGAEALAPLLGVRAANWARQAQWQEQARLAAAGEWERLRDLQAGML